MIADRLKKSHGMSLIFLFILRPLLLLVVFHFPLQFALAKSFSDLG